MGRIGAPGILDSKKDNVFCPQDYRGFASDAPATSKGSPMRVIRVIRVKRGVPALWSQQSLRDHFELLTSLCSPQHGRSTGPDEKLQGTPTLLSPGPGCCRSFQSRPLLLLLPSPQPILQCEEKQVRTHHQVRSHWSASFHSPHSLRSCGSGGRRVVFLIHVIHSRNLTDTCVGEHKLGTSCHGSGHRCRRRNRVA